MEKHFLVADKSEPFLPEKSFFPPRPISRASRQTRTKDSSGKLKRKRKKQFFWIVKIIQQVCIFTHFWSMSRSKTIYCYVYAYMQPNKRICWILLTQSGHQISKNAMHWVAKVCKCRFKDVLKPHQGLNDYPSYSGLVLFLPHTHTHMGEAGKPGP